MGDYIHEIRNIEQEFALMVEQDSRLDLELFEEGIELLAKQTKNVAVALNQPVREPNDLNGQIKRSIFLLTISNMFSLVKCSDLIRKKAIFEAEIILRSVLEKVDLMWLFHNDRQSRLVEEFNLVKYISPKDKKQVSEHLKFGKERFFDKFSQGVVHKRLKELKQPAPFSEEFYRFLSESCHPTASKIISVFRIEGGIVLEGEPKSEGPTLFKNKITFLPQCSIQAANGDIGRLCFLTAINLLIIEREFKDSFNEIHSKSYHDKVLARYPGLWTVL
jgi:hypothetical protein